MRLTHTPVLASALFLASCANAPRVARAHDDGMALPELTLPRVAHAAARASTSAEFAATGSDDLLAAPGAFAPQGEPRRSRSGKWRDRSALLQGFLGAQLFDKIERTGGSNPPVDGSGESLSQLPTIGGGAQWKLGGDRIDFGLEGMLAFNWRTNAAAFASGGGGAVVAVDVDLMLFELYGGPFLNAFLNDKVRVYGAAGPVMQWASYDQSGSSLDGDGTGFGVGYYTRAGLEFDVGSGTMIGFGVRWADTSVDLDGGQGKLDLEGVQIALTVSRWN